ncbi:MAG TPA: cytochrome c-type biogenesis protein [Chloroflexota bacterium]|jgi:cytochrome c-type biogenesis protein CcmH|nr:cytochrome c-type biogenesis protein [Chloroflexota bacterium]
MHNHHHLAFRALIFFSFFWLMGATVLNIASADDLDTQVRSVAKRLQCPICESVSVADSPSELAGQMRALIRTKLEQGESSDEIVAYFVERYGETVLVEPPRHGVGLLVWLGPFGALMVGALALAFWLRSGRRPASHSISSDHSKPKQADDWRLDAARRELDELSGESSA